MAGGFYGLVELVGLWLQAAAAAEVAHVTSEEIYIIVPESRVWVIPSETRVYYIVARCSESDIDEESRVYYIAPESRTYEVETR